MIKKSRYIILVVMILTMGVTSVNASLPQLNVQTMYAQSYTAGSKVEVILPPENVARLNPDNALGIYDAVQDALGSSNSKFYATASHEWTQFSFGNNFSNVNDNPDIEFCEVTWGSFWHTEAVLVCLMDGCLYHE